MDAVSQATPLMSLIGSLGSAAAAVAVLWLCLSYLTKRDAAAELLFKAFQEQLESIATDKRAVIRDVTAALTEMKKTISENISVTQRLEVAVNRLSESINKKQ